MLVPVAGGSLLDVVTRFFKEDDWPVQAVEGRTAVETRFRGDSGTWRCYAQAVEEKQRVVFYSILETSAPEDRRLAVAEYLTRANYGLVLGNFELDFADGEVRYKTSLDVEGGQLTATMVKNLVYANVTMMDRYLPGLMSVIYAGAAPADAVAKIEGK